MLFYKLLLILRLLVKQVFSNLHDGQNLSFCMAMVRIRNLDAKLDV
jgi:hypothetical protein